MSHEEQVGKNFAWGAVAQIITRLFGLGFFIFMSYVLLEKGMGQYNFITSFVGFWFILSDFGVSSYLFREWSRGDTSLEHVQRNFNIVLTMKTVMSVAILIPFCVVNWFINRDIFFPLILYYIYIFLSLIISQIETYLNSANNFKFGAIRIFIEKAVIIAIGCVALLLFPSVSSVFIAMVISQIVALLYYFSGRLPFSPSVVLDWKTTKYLVKKGLPFALFTIFASIYGRIDMTMLKFMQNFETVGWYGAAYKAFELSSIFSGVLFLPAIFPILSRIVNFGKRDEFRNFFNQCIRLLFASSLFLSIFFIFFAPYLIGWFFPASFVPSVLAMRIIVIVLVFASLSSLFNALLIIQNKEKISLKIITISCLANVFLNILLIPHYSLYGAAWATVIAEAINLILLQYFADWDIDKKMVLRMGIIFLTLTVFFTVIKILGLTNNMFIAFCCLTGTAVAVYIFGLLRLNDLQIFYLPFKNKFKSLFLSQNEI